MNFMEIMSKGGFMMWPLFLCSIFALAVLIDRVWFFYVSNRLDVAEFFPKVLNAVKNKDFQSAIEYCPQKKTPLTVIVKAALKNSGKPKEDIKEILNDVSQFEVPKMEKNLNLLATVAHVSPLLGLLGTVTGIIKCFSVIQQKAAEAGAVNPADLAGGIMEALHTTAFGLLVAIPSFIIYNYFVNKVSSSVVEMERCASELVPLISEA